VLLVLLVLPLQRLAPLVLQVLFCPAPTRQQKLQGQKALHQEVWLTHSALQSHQVCWVLLVLLVLLVLVLVVLEQFC